MNSDCLFLRYANGLTSPVNVAEEFISFTEDGASADIARKTLENPPDLSVFRKDFRAALVDIIENGISQKFVNYVDSYMKPSLMEYVKGSGTTRAGEERWIVLKEGDTPWIEALVCYNLLLYLRTYGIKELKLCPVCEKFFTNKGKYAKYCSEGCKARGKT